MLKVYGTSWCKDCKFTVKHLKERNIPYEYIDIESAPENIVEQVKAAYEGDGYVIPTFEKDGHWFATKTMDATIFQQVLDMYQLA